jgi:hypothetical protein
MKKTIGINPLEEYLSFTQEAPVAVPVTEVVPAQHIPKQRVTIHVPADLIDRVKNAVYWEPGLTLAGFAEMALAKALEDLEQERGAPFPNRRDKQLRGGRPIK